MEAEVLAGLLAVEKGIEYGRLQLAVTERKFF